MVAVGRRVVLVLLFLLGLALCSPVAAQDVGFFIRSSNGALTPGSYGAVNFNSSDGNIYAYRNAWVRMNAPYNNMLGSGSPGAGQDSTQGYEVGSFYYDTTASQLWVCSSNVASAAVWNQVSNLATSGAVLSALNTKLTAADWLGDFVVSGLLGSVPASSLTMTTPAGVAYVSGSRITPSSSSYTYSASSDTYDYLQSNGSINHVAEANNSPVPTGQTGLFIQKVVSNATQITSVTQTIAVAPDGALRGHSLAFVVGTNAPGNRQLTITVPSLAASQSVTIADPGASAQLLLGTSSFAYTAGGVVQASGGLLAMAPAGTSGQPFLSGGSSLGSFGIPAMAAGGTGANLSPAAGALVYSGSSTMAVGAAGTQNQVPVSNGTAAPGWANSWIGTQTNTANATLTTSSGTFQIIDTTSNAVTLTLPAASSSNGQPYVFLWKAGANTATVTAAGSDTISWGSGGASSVGFNVLGDVWILESHGSTTWRVIRGPVKAGPGVSVTSGNTGSTISATAGQLGGDGSDGAISITTNTSDTSPQQRNATTFSVSSGVQLTAANMDTINASSTVTISGTVAESSRGFAGGQGGAAFDTNGTSFPGAGFGPLGGQWQGTVNTGGGGGGNGGSGGIGGSPTAGVTAPGGVSSTQNLALAPGSGGGGGMCDTSDHSGAGGGTGGGLLRIVASGAISVSSTGLISSLGGAAASATTGGGGGGGGAGGTILLYSLTSITNSGTINVSGGNGGGAGSSSLGAGGGGGGGVVLLQSPSNTLGTITEGGGLAGSPGVNGTAGSAGVTLNITNHPNLPLLAMKRYADLEMQYGGLLVAHCRALRSIGRMVDSVPYCLTGREVAAAIVACRVVDDESRWKTALQEWRSGKEAGTGRLLSKSELAWDWALLTAAPLQVQRDPRSFDAICTELSTGTTEKGQTCQNVGDFEGMLPCV